MSTNDATTPKNAEVSTHNLSRALDLLAAYANSGVPDDVSLACAQVCRELRDALAAPAAAAPRRPSEPATHYPHCWESVRLPAQAEAPALTPLPTCRLCGGTGGLHWSGCVALAGEGL